MHSKFNEYLVFNVLDFELSQIEISKASSQYIYIIFNLSQMHHNSMITDTREKLQL